MEIRAARLHACARGRAVESAAPKSDAEAYSGLREGYAPPDFPYLDPNSQFRAISELSASSPFISHHKLETVVNGDNLILQGVQDYHLHKLEFLFSQMKSLRREVSSNPQAANVASKVFVRSTKSGKVQKIVRELYLRQDIPCSSKLCSICPTHAPSDANGNSAK